MEEIIGLRLHKLIYNIPLRVCTVRFPFICYARSKGKADPKRNKFLKKKSPKIDARRVPEQVWH